MLFKNSTLTQTQKHLLATTLTLLIIASVAATCYAIYTLISTVGAISIINFFITASYVVLGTLFFLIFCRLLFSFYQKLYGFLFDPPKEPVSSWAENIGVQPVAKKINAQYADGKIVWNVEPETLDWSTEIANPITNYLEK